MKCIVCQIQGPDKFSQMANTWDWFTGYLKETVHFCPVHKDSPERKELWRLSRIKRNPIDLGPAFEESSSGQIVPCKATIERTQYIEFLLARYPWASDADLLLALKEIGERGKGAHRE